MKKRTDEQKIIDLISAFENKKVLSIVEAGCCFGRKVVRASFADGEKQYYRVDVYETVAYIERNYSTY